MRSSTDDPCWGGFIRARLQAAGQSFNEIQPREVPKEPGFAEINGDLPEAVFGGLWSLKKGLSAAIGSVPRAPHPTPPIWPVSRTSSTRRGRYPKGPNEESHQDHLLPPTTLVCGDSSLGQPMGLSCRLHCSIDRKLSTAPQITHATFGGDLTENLQPRRFDLIHRSFRCSLASWDSDTPAIARICPARSSSTSTASPGLGGTSDVQTPSMLNEYCCPPIIRRSGPVRGSRKILPRFIVPFSANQGKQKQLCERTPGGRLFRIGSHTLHSLLCGFPCSHFALRKG